MNWTLQKLKQQYNKRRAFQDPNTTNMDNDSVPNLADLSLSNSGLLYKLLGKLGLGQSTSRGYLARSLFISGITWLPLLILTMMQGLAFGNLVEANFIKDFATHARLLVIIPLLIFAEASVERRIGEQTIQFFRSGILTAADRGNFDVIKKNTVSLANSFRVDIVILLAIAMYIYVRWTILPGGISHWIYEPVSGNISWAGLWSVFVSLPLFQFILIRWMWRWICWLYLLYKISKLPLKLNPAHADLAGGLGFLGLPPSPFLAVNFALATLCSAVIAERIIFLGQHLADFYVILGALAVITIMINVLPLLVFTPPLVAARRKGIFEYSALVQKHHRDFDHKMLNGESAESPIGDPIISSMADINSIFQTVLKMQIFPFDTKIMASTLVIMILPVLPLLAFEYKLADILEKLAGLLF